MHPLIQLWWIMSGTVVMQEGIMHYAASHLPSLRAYEPTCLPAYSLHAYIQSLVMFQRSTLWMWGTCYLGPNRVTSLQVLSPLISKVTHHVYKYLRKYLKGWKAEWYDTYHTYHTSTYHYYTHTYHYYHFLSYRISSDFKLVRTNLRQIGESRREVENRETGRSKPKNASRI